MNAIVLTIFSPLVATESLLTGFSNTNLSNPKTACVIQAFQAELQTISTEVQTAAAADNVVVNWTILDPKNLPNYLYI
jgi:hypothetical protein